MAVWAQEDDVQVPRSDVVLNFWLASRLSVAGSEVSRRFSAHSASARD